MKASRAFAYLLVVVFGCVSIASADEVMLKGGGSIYGEIVSREDGRVVLKTEYGSVTFPNEDIEKVVLSTPLEKEIRNKVRALPASDTSNRIRLASKASEAGLSELSRNIYTQVVAIDPDQKTAREALGYVMFEGEWVSVQEKNLHPGLVPYQSRWVTRAERDELRARDEGTRYLAGFGLSPEEGAALLASIADIDLAVETRGGHITRRHVRSVPVQDKPYVYSVDILNWRRLGVFVGITFIDDSRNRIAGLGELQYTVYATEADALGNRKLGEVIIANTIKIKPDMWNKKSDFKYWDTKVNSPYEEIVSDEARALWASEYYMNYDGILYILANRDIESLTPPGVYYIEATFKARDKEKKVGRFVQYAELR